MISSPLSEFQVREITNKRTICPSQAGAWGDVEKPKHDMGFLIIVPDKTVEGEKVFGLVAVWTHTYQACHHSLGDMVHKPALLINIGSDWVYAFL